MELNGGILVVFVAAISAVWMKNIDDNESCTNWTLSGGSLEYEGMLTVFYEGKWVNICADSLGTSDQEEVCRRYILSKLGRHELDKVTMHSSNVYGALEQETTISYDKCTNKKENKMEHKCNAASLCCFDKAFDGCSSNWVETLRLPERYPDRNDKSRKFLSYITYSQLTEINFTQSSINKGWIRTALQEDQCTINTSVAEGDVIRMAKNCSKSCLVVTDLAFVLFHDENRACCLENVSSQSLVTSNCSVRTLSIAEHPNEKNHSDVRFCIAAEVILGRPYVTVEDCGLFFRPFFVSESLIPDNKGMTTETSQRGDTSKTSKHNSSLLTSTTNTVTASSTVKDVSRSVNTVLIAVAVSSSLLFMMIIAFTTVILWKLKQSSRRTEQQRPNSVANRTYAVEGFQQLHQDDEEYTLISDMEVEHGSSGSYRPPIPDRGDSSKNEKVGTEIIILGEYTSPSDEIRLGQKISQASDYCMTTYDDPVRLKARSLDDQNGDNDCIEKESCNKEHQPNNRENTNSAKVLNRNSRNSQTRSVHDSVIVDLKLDIQGVKTNTLFTNSNTIDAVSGSNNIPLSQHEETMQKLSDKKRILQSFENFNISDLLGREQSSENSVDLTKKSDTNVSSKESDDSDYEETGKIDGNFPSCPSKQVLEEHVCLHCLKPEHLTKLGIKIISAEMYEKHTALQRRLSEPLSQNSYYNMESIVEKETVNKTNTKQLGVQSSNVQQYGGTPTEVKVSRTKKTPTNTKRCSVCNTVYDRLGNTSQNAWANCTDNVYDKFGDLKHFKHRQQMCGKRVNST